jgi:hypothetical protein
VSAEEFGQFSGVFARGDLDVPGYLPLLNLGDAEEVLRVVDGIREAYGAGDPSLPVAAMLADRNWRPHLVAAVAFLLDTDSLLDPGLLWSTIERGSWVIPQLAVAAMYTDPDFAPTAAGVVERLGHRNGKLTASIIGLRAFVPSMGERVDSWRADPVLIEALEADAAWDGSGAIAAHWAERIRELLARRGIDLQPRAA